MAAAKACKRCQTWFCQWIDRNESLQPNRSKMKCDVWKLCTSSDQRWQDELRFSISRFLEQFAFVNSHLLCYWPTIHNLISKISRLAFLKRASSDCRRLRNTLCLCLPVRRTPTRPSSPRGQAVPDRGPKSSAIDFCSQLYRLSSGRAFGSDCQMTGRGLNLDSNLNSAAWPTSCRGFICSETPE